MNATINNRERAAMSCKAKRIALRWTADTLFHPPLHAVIKGEPRVLNSYPSRRTNVHAQDKAVNNFKAYEKQRL
jgi:hypothetical protein